MEVTIYGDIVFLINFFMDFLILWVTAVLGKKKTSKTRLFLGSLFLSLLYCGGIILPFLSFFCYGIGGMLLLFFGILIVFFPKTIKEAIQYFLVANVTAFALGGVAMALFFATGMMHTIANGVVFRVGQFPLKILLTTACFFYILIKIGKNWAETNIINRRLYCDVVIEKKGIKIPLRMLIDTGNGLKDPFSGNDVAIVSFRAIKKLFSKEVQLYFFKTDQNQQNFYEYVLKTEKTLTMHLIPFSSLGKENGLLLVFQPEGFEIKGTQKNDVSVGVYCGCFHGGYDGLLSPELLK